VNEAPVDQVSTAPDKRAVRILFDRYWGPSGWKPDGERSLSADDFEYAKSRGLMFDPARVSHNLVLDRLRHAVNKLTPREAGKAFLASLSTRRLDWRSALGSYAVFRHVPLHAEIGKVACDICGLRLKVESEDLSVLNFERLKWGGVRHTYPVYALLDLELFLAGPRPRPSEEDLALFEALVHAIDAAPSDTTSAELHKVFPKELKANKAERDVILNILGFVGALGTDSHPGFAERFVAMRERRLPDRRFVDMAYPACWWRRSDGVRRERLREFFGDLPAI
jgi:hypothetical protein